MKRVAIVAGYGTTWQHIVLIDSFHAAQQQSVASISPCVNSTLGALEMRTAASRFPQQRPCPIRCRIVAASPLQ
jgi:hypothetical protein